MDKATGIVRSLVSGSGRPRAIVDVDASAVCARCAAGKGCGAGLLGGAGRKREVEARIMTGLHIEAGDRVEMALRPRDLLHASVIVYLPPLLGAVIAAGIAHGLRDGDIETAAAALIGMAAGLFASRLYLNRVACLDRYTPRIDRVLSAGVA